MADITSTTEFIYKDKPATEGMDYAFLREAGINSIQSVSAALWTDHNIHDPGITILEVLAYAITDISARANKPVGDLLASKPNPSGTEKDFFTATEILPCSPVTANDFRKLLIDHNKIRNAWLTKSIDSEQIFYLDRPNKKLTYAGGERVYLNGLYNILLEFEEDEELGDLNSSVVSGNVIGGTIEVAFPFWDEISAAWANDLTITDVQIIQSNLVSTDAANHTYFMILRATHNAGFDQFGVTVTADLGITEVTIQNKLKEFDSASVIKAFNKKIIAANAILSEIRFYLNENRNLDEDFFAFKATRVQEISISAQLEIAQGVNPVPTLAEIFYRLDKFLSPQIQFHTLAEMLARPGMTVDKILEGPLLENGFIDDSELVESKRNNIVYTSDLLGIIMSLNNDFNYGNSALTSQNKGIVSVKNLTITNYINNQIIKENVHDCLSLTLTDIYKPRLSIDKSVVRVIRNSIEATYSLTDVLNALAAIKLKNTSAKTPIVSNIEIPPANNLFVDDYYSIENDFPLTYGIGKAGLPPSASVERRAQANQLKGFLVFFEQLLANYLSQLAHIKDLFSINAATNNTYFWQSLKDIPGKKLLFSANYESTIPVLLSELEEKETGIDRRNNFLDHLLARFGEDFTEYALLMYARDKNTAPGILINDKSTFLKNYAALGFNRSKSFNYLSTDNWGTDNVPWLKRRICGLTGISKYEDEDLATNDNEGFHMVENVLLRPRVNDTVLGQDVFLKVKLDGDGNIIEGKKDPYSFRLIFVFPGWHTTGRFADADFKQYIEKIIQRETPAHILAEIYWLTDKNVMADFETALKGWLVAIGASADASTLSKSRNKLVNAINVFF
jgi:hypothetical protein